MIIRLKWKKVSDTFPMAKCWYCEAPTNSALYELDGSEIWCCKDCYKKHGRIRKHTSPKKSSKKFLNNIGNNMEISKKQPLECRQ